MVCHTKVTYVLYVIRMQSRSKAKGIPRMGHGYWTTVTILRLLEDGSVTNATGH
tara:strand:- start:109 stop:270 length:162 start_codon:yes stop_codon:yes gene_type:complete